MKLHEHLLPDGWRWRVQPALSIFRSDDQSRQTQHSSSDEKCTPTWKPFQSWVTKGYNEYCHWSNFRKGRRGLPNKLWFLRKGCKKWIIWVTSEREKHTIAKTNTSTKKKSDRKQYDLAKETVFTSYWLCSLVRFQS